MSLAGCLNGNGDKVAAKKNREIENFLKSERQSNVDQVKLLLLGTGGSGKSTIAKQMKIIHLCGFPEEEKMTFKFVIYHNALNAMSTLIREAQDREMVINDTESVDLILSISLKSVNDLQYTKAMADAIETLWAEQTIKEIFGRSNEFQLDDSASYFLDNCQKFCKADFSPSDGDMLRARSKTTGIVEINFVVNKKNFMLVDVGGQRNERKKWIHCFDDVTSVIYCVAMNDYDLLLEEDGFTNRMHESLKVFGEVINYSVFFEVPIILFLNKRDLFQEKIKRVDLSVCFPVYNGGLDYAKGSEYIKKKFTSKNDNKGRKIYPHFTTATDTHNVKTVFLDVEKMIVDNLVDDCIGF